MSKKTAPQQETKVDFARLQGGQWDLPRCFVIHAWSPPGIRHVITHIRNALKDNFHVRADLDFTGESIREQVLAAIEDAALVICILDDLRPNIPFELGYAYALGKPCVLMVREGAQVNVRDYYPEDQREGKENPALNVDAHFSDIKDLLLVEYDHEKPEAPARLLAEELKKTGSEGKTLSRRVLEAWVGVWKHRFGAPDGCFDTLFDFILKSRIVIDKPLFATKRKKRFGELLKDGLACATKKKKPKVGRPAPLQSQVIEAAMDLPRGARLPFIERLLKTYKRDLRLLFAQAYTVAMLVKAGGYKDQTLCGRALQLHKELVAEWPEAAEARNNYANLLGDLNRPEEAEAHYQEALRINPDLAEAHY
ncbi:MAG: tetratricopeptide repeat protein, partial [Phycisphaerae bacterium]